MASMIGSIIVGSIVVHVHEEGVEMVWGLCEVISMRRRTLSGPGLQERHCH